MFDDLANKEFRDAILEENISTGVAFQVRALRDKKNWSQARLGEEAGKPQNVISRIEDPNYGKLTIRTLLNIASAFDVALLVKFVPYTRFVSEFDDLSPQALAVASYEEEKVARAQDMTAGVTTLAQAEGQHPAPTMLSFFPTQRRGAARLGEAGTISQTINDPSKLPLMQQALEAHQ